MSRRYSVVEDDLRRERIEFSPSRCTYEEGRTTFDRSRGRMGKIFSGSVFRVVHLDVIRQNFRIRVVNDYNTGIQSGNVKTTN